MFRLGRRRRDGTTERDHLEAHARATGEAPPELRVPPVPPGTEALWQAFNELSGARVPGGTGIGPITLSEIAAWQRVFGVRLTPWEVETILAVDRAALTVVSEKGSQ